MNADSFPMPFGPFTLLRLLAQGGMGAVYLALRPIEDGEERSRPALRHGEEEVCVVKTVRGDLRADREAVARFLDEARVVQKLDHPRIVHTLDAGLVDETYFLCLEFISGRNLRDVTTRATKLGVDVPEQVRVHVVAEMLEALDYAHGIEDPDTGRPLNVVHRDVSPHNLMVGFDGNAKLIDFGLASHELKRELTRPGVMVGKLRYNAPEQVRDRALDGRSDVYSVGVVLYELYANERFYEGLQEEQVWRVGMKGDWRPRLFRTLPRDLQQVLDVALQPDPTARFATAGEFRRALLDVAAARGLVLSDLRRTTSRYMREIFADEMAAEREMILQATGVAEARTQLIKSPAELRDAIGNLGAHGKAPAVRADVDGARTELLDANAEQLAELRALGGHFASPDAATMLPQEPVDDGDDAFASAPRTRNARGRQPGSTVLRIGPVSKPPRVPTQSSSSGIAEAHTQVRSLLSDLPEASAGNIYTAPGSETLGDEDDDHPAHGDNDVDEDEGRTRDDRAVRRDAVDAVGRREVVRVGNRSARDPDAPPSLSVSKPSSSRINPLPPLPPPRTRRRIPPAFAIAGGAAVVLVLGLVAAIVVPRMLRRPSTPIVAGEGAAPIAIGAALTDAGPSTTLPGSQPRDIGTAGAPDAGSAHAEAALDAGIGEGNGTGSDAGIAATSAPDAGIASAAAVVDAGTTGIVYGIAPADAGPLPTTGGAKADAGSAGATGSAGVGGSTVVHGNTGASGDGRRANTGGKQGGATSSGGSSGASSGASSGSSSGGGRSSAPPKKELKGFGQQVDYLKQYCVQRVACARSIVDDSRQIATMSAAEVKDLRDEAPRCIERCRR